MALLAKAPARKRSSFPWLAPTENSDAHDPSTDLQVLLKKERARSDRSGLPFSQILFECSEAGRSVFDHTLRLVYRRIRLTDEVRLIGDGKIAVVLPDTSSEGARALADSILEALQANDQSVTCKLYSYPSMRFNNEH